jgi:hypothetical protein
MGVCGEKASHAAVISINGSTIKQKGGALPGSGDYTRI